MAGKAHDDMNGDLRQWMQPLAPVDADDDSATTGPSLAGWSHWLDDDNGVEQTPARVNGEQSGRGATDAEPLLSDDPLAGLTEELQRGPMSGVRRRRLSTASVAIGVVAAVCALVGGGWALISGDGDAAGQEPALTLVPAAPTSSTGEEPRAPWCPDSVTGSRVIGAGPGDLASATGVILYQQHALYVSHDAAAARSVLAPDALAAPVEATRAAIAAIPVGTQHCVTIFTLAPDRFDVRVDERHLDGSITSWQQIVTTTNRDGRTVITSITAGGGGS